MFDVAAGFGNQFPQGEDGKILGRLENVVFYRDSTTYCSWYNRSF